MIHGVLAFLVPPLCGACRVPLARADDAVCAGCRRALPWLAGARCPRCALPLDAGHACPAARMAFSASWAAVGYAGVARELVAALKFRRGRPLADLMAAHLVAGAPRSLLEDVAIVPVPTHPAHARRRGYDQSELLARALARRAGAPLARPLRRRGPARSQRGASRAERLERGRVDVVARGRAPARALLVDDVHTTGATLDACARALLAAGSVQVCAVTWARTLHGGRVGHVAVPR